MKYVNSINNKVILKLKVYPGSNCTKLRKIDEELIHIDIGAAPEKNKANKELICFISTLFNISKSTIKIVSGSKDKHKVVVIDENISIEWISTVINGELRK